MESTKLSLKNQFPILFYNPFILGKIYSFLPEESITKLKNCIKKTGMKEQKKKIKELVTNYIIDYGKNNEKVKYNLSLNGVLTIYTSIFNIQHTLLKQLTNIKYNEDLLQLEKEDLFKLLRALPKNEIFLTNTEEGLLLKLSKPIIGYDYIKDNENKTLLEDDEKYEIFYNENNLDELKEIDFSNKEEIIERQKNILNNLANKEIKSEEFYPLKFIMNVNYWIIILCEGGYFAYGLFLKDQLIDHKSDHKYVIRKKAGQRQIIKDKSKTIKSSIGAQIRRANEKKHQENIDLILKVNEDYLIKADCIFIQAPGVNKRILVGNDRPLFSYKKKIFNIPFNLQRANYSNLMYTFQRLTNITLDVKDDNVKGLFKNNDENK